MLDEVGSVDTGEVLLHFMNGGSAYFSAWNVWKRYIEPMSRVREVDLSRSECDC